MDIESYIKDLSPELQEKARGCKSTTELLALAKQEGVALPDEAMAAIAGGDDQEVGKCRSIPPCPKCGSKNVVEESWIGDWTWYKCQHCKHEWEEFTPS